MAMRGVLIFLVGAWMTERPSEAETHKLTRAQDLNRQVKLDEKRKLESDEKRKTARDKRKTE